MIERTDARAVGTPLVGAPTCRPLNEMMRDGDRGTRGKGTHEGCPYYGGGSSGLGET